VSSIIILVVLAGLIWRFGAWALVLGAIAGLRGTVLVFESDLTTAPSNVNSVFDSRVAVIVSVGSILVLVGSIVAFVQLRRGTAVSRRHPLSGTSCEDSLLS